MHLPSCPSSSVHRLESREEDTTPTTIPKPSKTGPWSLDLKELTLNSSTIANWGLQEAELLGRYLRHPLNALESVNLWCFSGWNLSACDVNLEVYDFILQSLGRMPLLQLVSLDCNGIALSRLPTSLLHLPMLEIRRVQISVKDARIFAQALTNQEYEKKNLSFCSLDDASVANLFAALEENPLENLEKLEAKNLRSSGLRSMSKYLQGNSPEELILRDGTWTADKLGKLVKSLTVPSNAVTKLKFHQAAFPPCSAHAWKQFFQQKTNLQTLSFIDLNGNTENHFNEGLVRAFIDYPKLPRSLSTLDLIHTLQPTRPPYRSLASILPALIQQNPQIRTWNLQTSLAGLQDGTMIPIAKVLATSSVERLDLSNAHLTQVGLETVIRLLPPTLKHLNLSRIQISDNMANLLGQWLSQPECCVEELILDWCQLTPIGLELVFAALATATATSNKNKLGRLSLQWCEPLGVKGWQLLAHYLPHLPESLVDLSFGCFPLALRETRQERNARGSHRELREKEKLQSMVLRREVMDILREQTNLLNINLQLDLPIASYASYFAQRNRCFQTCLRDGHLNSSWEDLLWQIRRPPTITSNYEPLATTISTSLVERALQRSMRASADAAGICRTDDCELSLLYDCFSQRPELITPS